MKKRILKIAALVAALALIVGVCWFANGLVGNPISKMLAKNSAEKHLEETYADKDFEIERIMFSFKDGYYHAFITSPSSIDSSFTLLIDMWGTLRSDTYEDRVLSGWNTAYRLETEYRNAADAVLDSKSFPYTVNIGFGELEFASKEYDSAPSYAIITEELTLDAVYNLNELGAKAGKLTVYVYDNTVSIERLAEILLDLREIFDDAGVKFYVVDCVLEYPKDENGTVKEGRVEVMDFLYADIYEEGMVERVHAANDAANAYHEEQDAEKLGEIENSR